MGPSKNNYYELTATQPGTLWNHWKRVTTKLWRIFWPGIAFRLKFAASSCLLQGRILRPRTITYLLCLLFDLDTRASVIASNMNLEAGLCFVKIWLRPIKTRTRKEAAWKNNFYIKIIRKNILNRQSLIFSSITKPLSANFCMNINI